MLKKRIGAVALTAAMVATSFATVSAKTPITSPGQTTITVIDENFDNFEEFESKMSTTETALQNSNISYKAYDSYSVGSIKVIKEDNSTNKYLEQGYQTGSYLNFENPSATGTTEVKEGDIVTIKFKIKNNGSGTGIALNLNNNTPWRYTAKASLNNNGGFSYPDSNSNADNGRILKLHLKNGAYSFSDKNDYAVQPMSKDGWSEITVVINTKDANQNNEQTITVDADYEGETERSYFYGLLDANYTGSGDTTYDKITSIDSIKFDTYSACWTSANTDAFLLDDLSVKITGTRDLPTGEYTTGLTKTLLDEDFDDMTWSESGANWSKADINVTGTDIVLNYEANGGSLSAGDPDPASDNKAFKMSTDSDSNKNTTFPMLRGKFDYTVEKGDVVKMSFDVYRSNNKGGVSAVLVNNDTDGNRTPFKYGLLNESNWGYTNESAYTNASGSAWYYPDTNYRYGFLGGSNFGDNSADCWYPFSSHGGGNPELNTFGTGKWYTMELIVDTENEAYDGVQTLTTRYKEKGTDNWLQYHIGKMDADASDDKITLLNNIKEFRVMLDSKASETDVYVDNMKCEVIKPGYETWGTAANGTDTTYSTGKLKIKAAADPNFKWNADNKTTDSANVKLLVAVYNSDDVLTSCAVKDGVISDGSYLIETNEIEIGNDADYIKLYLMGDNGSLMPYLGSVELTRAGVSTGEAGFAES